jgi:hypothetical protein
MTTIFTLADMARLSEKFNFLKMDVADCVESFKKGHL